MVDGVAKEIVIVKTADELQPGNEIVISPLSQPTDGAPVKFSPEDDSESESSAEISENNTGDASAERTSLN